MAEPENKTTDPVEDKKTDPTSEEMIGGKKFSELDPETQKAIKDLREENKTKRLANDDLTKRLTALEAAQAAKEQEAATAAQKLLQEQGEYKKLYEATQPQIEELKTVKGRVKELEAFVTETLETRINAIPENRRSLVTALPQMDALTKLKWIEANASLLSTPAAPNLDAGKTTGQGKVDDPAIMAEMLENYRRGF